MNFTIHTPTPHQSALWFQAFLGADKGHASTLRQSGHDWIVESDGKIVRFTKGKQ